MTFPTLKTARCPPVHKNVPATEGASGGDVLEPFVLALARLAAKRQRAAEQKAES